MKKFLKNIIIFAFGVLALNFILYIFVFKPAFFERYLYNEDTIEDYNLFLLSDSHGGYLKEIPSQNKIFNFSYPHENYLDMFMKIKYLTSIISEGDTILLSIDNHSLSTYRDDYGRADENIIFVKDIEGINPTDLESNYNLSRIMRYFPLAKPSYNKFILTYLKGFILETKNNTNYSKLSSEQKKIACQNRYVLQFENEKMSFKQKKYLTKIISLCKTKNITLIGIKFPITKEYWEIMGHQDFGIDKFWHEQGLKIIDLHDLFFDKDQYFEDQDHLNVKGGELFCKEIHKYL